MAAMLQDEVALIQKQILKPPKGAELRHGPSQSILSNREAVKTKILTGANSTLKQSFENLSPIVAVAESQPEELESASPGKRSSIRLSRSSQGEASPAKNLIRKLSRAPTTLEVALAEAEQDEDREQPYAA